MAFPPDTSYATPALLRPRCNLPQIADPLAPTPAELAMDSLLQGLLNGAAAFVDSRTRGLREGYEAFHASATELRLFHDHKDGRIEIDDLLLTVTPLITRSGQTVPSTAYVLEPLNRLPKTTLLLLSTAPRLSVPQTGPYSTGSGMHENPRLVEAQIGITGVWGYSATCPAAVQDIVLTLAERKYQRMGRQPVDPMGLHVAPEMVLDRYLIADLARYKRCRMG